MDRFITLIITLLIFYASLVTSEILINTPESPLIIGKVETVSWSSDTPLEGTGELRLMFNASVNILVDLKMDLKPLFYNWIITSPPGTYYWGLFSTQKAAFSREFSIINAPDTSSPTTAIATASSPATTIIVTKTQTIINNGGQGSSLSKGIIIGVASVVGIAALAGLSVYGFLYFRRRKYIPTPGEDLFCIGDLGSAWIFMDITKNSQVLLVYLLYNYESDAEESENVKHVHNRSGCLATNASLPSLNAKFG
ncbi:19216_t:CDS:2 [Funneliformis geosporum]|uniref:19216_t:CDS:1 n=1 Tax=Funneliformis geosporum TaxID=1117311 RepID=A0A9W4WRH8_9GLOM|nr:19216_t:CDS:2 [Funneliformis geosporum]